MPRSYQTGIHTGALASVSDTLLTCDRCGSFALLRWSWGARLCEACVARRHPALTTDRRAGTLMLESLRVLPALGVTGILVALAPLLPVLALRFVWPVPDSGNERADVVSDLGPSAVSGVLAGFVTAVFTVVLLQILVGNGRRDYRAAVAVVRSRALAIAGLSLALTLVGDLMFLVLSHTGYVLVWLGAALAYPVLLHERVNPMTAYMRSGYRLQGSYLRLLGATIVLALPALFAVLVFAVGSLAASEGETLGAVALAEGSGELLTLPLTALSAILYVKLPPRMSEPEPQDMDANERALSASERA